jgi:hypothetical protein
VSPSRYATDAVYPVETLFSGSASADDNLIDVWKNRPPELADYLPIGLDIGSNWLLMATAGENAGAIFSLARGDRVDRDLGLVAHDFSDFIDRLFEEDDGEA